MITITEKQITAYVEANIGSFHDKRLESLNKLKLNTLLRRKNPYLFRSKNVVTVSDLIKSLLDAHLSSQEETLFGDFLEGLAVHVAGKVHNGLKSSATGIDLEFVKDGSRYIISIKSGPNWGNSSQIAKMKDNFKTAGLLIRRGNPNINVVAVNGCCYGRDAKPDNGDYFKYCGQEFWHLISNDVDFYTRIIEPLGHNAKQRNDSFIDKYGAVVNRLSQEFSKSYCDQSGAIDWETLVEFISAITPLIDRPIGKGDANKLPTVVSISDTLRYWDEPALADRIDYITAEQDQWQRNEPASLSSLRGFLMFWSAVESDGEVSLHSTPDGLLAAEWQFSDQRAVEIRFLDIDHVALSGTGSDGEPLRIRNAARSVVLRTATRRLIEHGLFTRFENTHP